MSAGRRLVRALEASAASAECMARITIAGEQPWSSATFVGTRHAVTIEDAVGPRLSAWLDRLEGAIPILPGHVIAELVIRRHDRGAGLDVLTLETR